jgi:iron complex transport system ATP-binding protein
LATPALLDFRRVSVMRGARLALDDVTLRIEAGEHAAILGPNGSGKSTLIKAIARECYPLARPESSLQLFGRDRWNVFELRSLLGIVSNDLMSACARDTAGADVVLSGFFSGVQLWPHQEVTPAMRAKAEEALDRAGVGHLATRSILEMSSGEARRVLIARALVHDPRALLFDEPGNSLDPKAHSELRGALSRLAQSGLGIVLVTHHLPDIIPEIDRIVLLRAGRVLGDCKKAAALTSETLSSLFGYPVEVNRRDGYYQLW